MGAEIIFVGLPANAALVKQVGLADEVHSVYPRWWKAWTSGLKALRAIRQKKTTVFLDFEPTSFLSALFGWFSGAPQRIGFLTGKPSREKFFTHLVSYAGETQLSALFSRFAAAFGLTVFPPARRERSHRSETPTFVFNVNASDLSLLRLWPASHWVELAGEVLCSSSSARLVFSGLSSEKARVQGIVDSLHRKWPADKHRVTNAAGETDLKGFLETLSQSDLVVSVDSAALHLAAWLGVPCIGLFGPENPDFLAPKVPWVETLTLRLTCSPCLAIAANKVSRCQDNVCLKGISAAQVFKSVQRWLPPSKEPSGEPRSAL
jgi:ADP-heptose:LPS heptosyltransferase